MRAAACPNPPQMHIGRTIRRLRQERDWSAADLARACNVSHAAVRAWEAQPYVCITTRNLAALLSALGIDDADLVRFALAGGDRVRASVIESAERFDAPRLERLYQRVLELTPPPSDLPLPSDQTHTPGAIRDPALWPPTPNTGPSEQRSSPPPAKRKKGGGGGAA